MRAAGLDPSDCPVYLQPLVAAENVVMELGIVLEDGVYIVFLKVVSGLIDKQLSCIKSASVMLSMAWSMAYSSSTF